MKVNFTDVPDAPGFDPVPADTYVVNVANGELKESGDSAKHPGTPYVNWDFVVAEGEYQGRHIFTITSLHQDSLQYGLKPFLKALGYGVDGELEFNVEDCINKQLKVKVNVQKGNEEYPDPKNNVRAFYSVDDPDAPKAGANAGSGSLLPT